MHCEYYHWSLDIDYYVFLLFNATVWREKWAMFSVSKTFSSKPFQHSLLYCIIIYRNNNIMSIFLLHAHGIASMVVHPCEYFYSWGIFIEVACHNRSYFLYCYYIIVYFYFVHKYSYWYDSSLDKHKHVSDI